MAKLRAMQDQGRGPVWLAILAPDVASRQKNSTGTPDFDFQLADQAAAGAGGEQGAFALLVVQIHAQHVLERRAADAARERFLTWRARRSASPSPRHGSLNPRDFQGRTRLQLNIRAFALLVVQIHAQHVLERRAADAGRERFLDLAGAALGVAQSPPWFAESSGFPGSDAAAIKHKGDYRTSRKTPEAHGLPSVGLSNVR
jgi:hypothetical protein